MSYYQLFGLSKEPFSTSPDPNFFFLTKEHKAALVRLQIAIRLRRGLCVLMGDVGTGKTTLSRKLAQELRDEKNVIFHMVLNPYFKSQRQFLFHLAKLFHLHEASPRATGLELMEGIEKYLFHKGVTEGKTVVLLIDEAQIVPDYVFEILRILLNYETNEYKILQLVLVGQMELLPRISNMPNFWDRIALKYVLNPLDRDELEQTVGFRLTQAGCGDLTHLFTSEALDMIHRHTEGYPRKFTLMCHNALESLVMYDKKIVDAEVIKHLISQEVERVKSESKDKESDGTGSRRIIP